jgi:hypothetical protein
LAKKRNFDPHAAKALNKKLWYLRDQQVVATTNPESRHQGVQNPTTDQKNQHQPQKVKLLQTERKKYFPDRKKHSKATGSVTISPKAILGAANHLAQKDLALSQGHTLAGQPATVKTGQKEVLAAIALVKENHSAAARVNLTAADRQPVTAKDQKGVSAVIHKAKRNLTHLHAPAHQQASKANLKEALVVMQAANANLHHGEQKAAIVSLHHGELKAALKNAKVALKRNHHLAKGPHTGRMTGKTNRMPLKPCVAVKMLLLKNQKMTA